MKRSSRIVYDQAGNRMSQVLLLVMERDERGPRILKHCRDDETVELATAGLPADKGGDGKPTFVMVWAADGSQFETNIEALQRQADAKADQMFGEEIRQRDHVIEQLRAANAKLVAADEEKTIELRLLHRERDPARFESALVERVARATAELEGKLRQATMDNAELQRQIEEQKRSKKKLREALDRLKDKT